MRKLKSLILILAVVCIGINQVSAIGNPVTLKKTAENVLTMAGGFSEMNVENAKVLKAEIISLSV